MAHDEQLDSGAERAGMFGDATTDATTDAAAGESTGPPAGPAADATASPSVGTFGTTVGEVDPPVVVAAPGPTGPGAAPAASASHTPGASPAPGAGSTPGEAPEPATPTGGVFGPRFRWISIGMCSLILLAAFESLAITTVMPTISADLDGASLYALAFAGPLAVGVVGMVTAGNWADRRGPRSALYISCVLFIIGLLIAGTATSMWVLVIGRLVHGFGGGGASVALYVIVARLYPPALQPKIFAGFAAAWVVPSLVGPFVAGLVAEQFSWHWVFLGVIALVIPALFMVIPSLRSVTHDPDGAAPVPWNIGPILWSIAAAAAVMALNLAADTEGALRWIISGIALIVTVVALRPLLPARALLARRGLPSVILMRGLIGTAFFGAEVYLPYLLIDEYGLSPAVAGLALTAGGIFWALGSWAQGRSVGSLSNMATLRIGTTLLTLSILTTLAMTIWALSPIVALVAWAGAGAGMGTMHPRLSVLALSLSTRQTQGFNSAALTIADSMGAAIALALSAFIFAGLSPFGATWSFAGCFALAAVACFAAVALAHRILPKKVAAPR